MLVDNLLIPDRLVALINNGFWPRTDEEELRQNLKPLVPEERIKIIAPEQNRIYFVQPPFNTVARLRKDDQNKFWSTFAAPEDIEAGLAVFIGDFGIGSDAPILLDYRKNRLCPTVIRLKWNYGVGQRNQWLTCANNFDQFADTLYLDSPRERISHPSCRN
jgi:hypothetical protein